MRSNRLRVGSELVMRVSNVASNARLFGLVSFSMLYAKLLYIVIQCLLKFRDPKSPDPKSPRKPLVFTAASPIVFEVKQSLVQ